MKIAIGCDHGGYSLKQEILRYLEQKNIAYTDCGCDSEASVDYPIYAKAVTDLIQNGECERGILVCGTGIGMSIAANKRKGIRAAVCHDTFSARMTRMHNDTNVLCLGGRVVGSGLALDIVELFLQTEFLGDRHARRVQMISDLENN